MPIVGELLRSVLRATVYKSHLNSGSLFDKCILSSLLLFWALGGSHAHYIQNTSLHYSVGKGEHMLHSYTAIKPGRAELKRD